MKIALVQPPNRQRSGTWKKQLVYRTPTNLALLASYVRENGHDPVIYDLDIEGGTSSENAALVMSTRPRVIGFTCLTPRFPVVLEISAECKKIDPAVKVVVGGSHVSGQPAFAMRYKEVDFGIVGEGEEAFLDLLSSVMAGNDPGNIPNVAYRKGEEVRVNPVRPYIKDLDTLPFPAWDLLKIEAYRDPAFFKGPHFGVLSGRGCPWNCNFCASKVVWGRKTRLRSPVNIVDELEYCVKKFNINEFMFYDDTFTVNKKGVYEIYEEITKRDLKIRFYAQARVDTIDYELAVTLKKAGCFAVAIGVESGNEKVLQQISKSITKDQIRKACQGLKKADMPFLASYIIGHPGDTHESIKETIDFANELDADQSKFLIATPYPGTELHKIAVKKGIIPEEGAVDLGDHTYFQHVAANLSCVSDKDLLGYQQTAFDDYDLRKRPLVRV